MRYSRLLLPTLREEPKDAEIKSHILMIRAGLIRKTSAGLYTFMPLGLRSLRKVMDIIRDEMDKAGAQELLPPFVTPAELWKESGRFFAYGKELLRFKDRHNVDLILGPTHEETFTSIVRENIQSYRDLPLNLYQINLKFRDEIRPRFGVMRAREFIMKDAYSFDIDEAGLETNYQAMRKAYRKIFKRCGLEVDPVQADTGAMGGSASEEFMVASEVGEEEIVKCPECGYIANTERAVAFREFVASEVTLNPVEEVATPDVRTIEELTVFFKTQPDKFIKSIVYIADSKPILAIIRGDLEINEVKLKNAIGAAEIELADDETILKVTGAPVGFAGPSGISGVKIIADDSVKYMSNVITGANKKDTHIINVNIERDFKVDIFADISLVKEGDACPECKTPLSAYRGIEVGHIFKLGYKYTKSMNVTFQDENGEDRHPVMGCYGIGVGRTLASVIEQSHDKDGIIWPMSIAPYHIIIVPVNISDEKIMNEAERLYKELGKNYEVLLDDRDERAGVKFKDADLIGIPIRLTVGKSFVNDNKLELKARKGSEAELVSPDLIDSRIGEIYAKEMGEYSA